LSPFFTTSPTITEDELNIELRTLDEERALEEYAPRDETPSTELLEAPSLSPVVRLLEDVIASENIALFDSGTVKKSLDDGESSPQEAK
jgi:hypothetical protein